LGVSVCQWQTSCEPTESADETKAPKVAALRKERIPQERSKKRAALTEKGARQYARRPPSV
jgi:hypothetical protein